jgi:ankyrin repeat protein
MMAIKNGHEDAAKYLIESEHFEEYRDENNATLLHWAAKYGLASVVEKLASKGINLNDKDAEGRTPLDYALDSNDEDTINLLLKGAKHISRQDTVNIQSLHFSARTGDISMIKQLHKKGSSLEARGGKGQTVIFHAVKGKQYATMKWLLENNANIHAVDKRGFTALHIAAQECDLAATKILVEKGANVNALSSERLTPLLCIVDSQGIDVLRYLHDKGADLDAVDNDLERIAHKVARKGDSAALLWKAAYDLGCNITVSGKQGNTPAHLAAEAGSIAILKHLVEKKVDVHTCKNMAGYTPLMMAARAGKADSVRFLLENGCTHDIVDANGKALVELAIRWGNPSVMQVLENFGAEFDSFDSNSDAPHPVWHAIWEGQYASVKHVLENGLDANYTHRGISLLQCAIEAGNTDVVRLLIDAGADVGRADPYGWSPLHSAAFSGDKDVLLLALQRATDPSPRDEYGWTPLDLAAFYRHEDIVKVLDPDGKVTEFVWSHRSSKSSVSATHHYVPPMEDSAVTGYAEAPGSAR